MSHPCLKISEDLLLWEWNSNSSLLGWPKSSLGFFHKRLWKNPNELFCQSNRSRENGRFTGDKCWWVLTECEGRHQENSQIRRLRVMLLDHSKSVSWMIKYVDLRASKEKRNPNSFILIHRTQLEWPPQLSQLVSYHSCLSFSHWALAEKKEDFNPVCDFPGHSYIYSFIQTPVLNRCHTSSID